MNGCLCQADTKKFAGLSTQDGSGSHASPGVNWEGSWLRLTILAVLAVGALACAAAPEPEPEPEEAAEAVAPPPRPVDPRAVSGERAFRHLEALVEIGPRVSGSDGAEEARDYLATQLRAVGASVQRQTLLVPDPGAAQAISRGEEPGFREVTHVIGVLPGSSADRFVLAASYDTRELDGVEFVGANASGSGPALLLELARVLSLRDRPYTIVFALLDGDRPPAPVGSAAGFPGTRAWATQVLDAEGSFDRIRLAVFFQQVGDLDLEIARDLRSHHVYREFFWEAAGVLGHGAYFQPEAGVESVAGSHLELIEAGLPRAVLISDPRFGGSEVPGRYAGTEEDQLVRCSPHSLEVVGEVAVEALDRIARRLSRIDRFRVRPLEDPLPGGSESAPEPSPSPPPE